MNIPNDPVILLSYVNTMLRDKFEHFDDLCKSLDVNPDEISDKLKFIGYTYDKNLNRFK